MRDARDSAFTRVFVALCVCGPALLAREGCRASTRAPVGAPHPHFVWGETSKPRSADASRERWCMCANFKRWTPLWN